MSQDAHSLGEEAIYQVMWKSGRPENSDPVGSRTVRLGAAEIGMKVNMAKKNVRQNISRLYEKLAIEIIENFETISSQARLYRVFSYKQILDRRRAAGMEYVLRNKGVVFCTKDGEELVTSPAYVSTPGDETSIRPAPPKRRKRLEPETSILQLPTAQPPKREEDGSVDDYFVVSETFLKYGIVDDAAVKQLVRDCRKSRKDARMEEIAFFASEKLAMCRLNRGITNPTGLVIATVPQSFIGKAFDEFRARIERQAVLEREEATRKAHEEEHIRNFVMSEREKYGAVLDNPSSTQAQRDQAEQRLRQYAAWNE